MDVLRVDTWSRTCADAAALVPAARPLVLLLLVRGPNRQPTPWHHGGRWNSGGGQFVAPKTVVKTRTQWYTFDDAKAGDPFSPRIHMDDGAR